MNSILENQIKETFEKAFWDLLKEDLELNPQKFDHLMILIKEIKEKLISFTPNNTKLINEINEVIDIDFLNHIFESNGLDPNHFFNLVKFLINKIKTYSAPYMDKEIEEWEKDVFKKLENDINYAEFIKYFFTKLHYFLDIIHNDIQNFYKNQSQ